MADSLHASTLRCTVFDLERCSGTDVPPGDWLGAAVFSEQAPRVNFGFHSTTPHSMHAPLVPVPMPALAADGSKHAVCELWQVAGNITHGEASGLRYSHNGELLFGAVQLTESDFDTPAVRAAGKTPLQQAAEYAYRQIFQLLDTLNFPHVLRFWNYLADINGHSHGTERYRQFNIGRQDGFAHGGRHVIGSVPAASAVGFREGPLTVYFFAARSAQALTIENPRQVSAYEYPEDYGPRSPTFSRACVVRLGDDKAGDSDLLLISGTASIVGHESLHAGDVAAQTRETMTNISTILQEVQRVLPATRFALCDLYYKIYVRDAQDVAAIRVELHHILGDAAHLLFLRADICRHDLLMEIEASGGHPLRFDWPRQPAD